MPLVGPFGIVDARTPDVAVVAAAAAAAAAAAVVVDYVVVGTVDCSQ